MVRHVFFSFKYNPDVWRVNAIRNQSILLKAKSTGYWDNSIYERSLASNSEYIKRKIREALRGTSITVILITRTKKNSNYVKYEYQKSVEHKNGIVQLDVSKMRDRNGRTETFGGWLPYVFKGIKKKWYHGCPLRNWIEIAYLRR